MFLHSNSCSITSLFFISQYLNYNNMISQKLIIIILAIVLTVIFVWFVIVDNYIIPAISQQITTSYQTGYNAGVENSVTELFQQTSV